MSTKQEREERRQARFAALSGFDRKLRDPGRIYLCGVDEVGRGPLAGPVVTAAVVLPEDFPGLGIDDSKKLTDRMRREKSALIAEGALAFGFGERDAETIDRINILNATKEAMRDAVLACSERLRENVGEDISLVVVDAVTIPGLPFPQKAIVRGDSTSLSIAAASVLAKVRRDDCMIEMDSRWPGYDWASNKGYGTAAHYDGIRRLGLTPIHRRSFLKGFGSGPGSEQ